MRLVALLLMLGCAESPQGGVFVRDVTGDGIADRIVITDERDGFRRTFAYADIYVNGAAEPVTAKLKDGRWIWVDPAKFPGLAALPVH